MANNTRKGDPFRILSRIIEVGVQPSLLECLGKMAKTPPAPNAELILEGVRTNWTRHPNWPNAFCLKYFVCAFVLPLSVLMLAPKLFANLCECNASIKCEVMIVNWSHVPCSATGNSLRLYPGGATDWGSRLLPAISSERWKVLEVDCAVFRYDC